MGILEQCPTMHGPIATTGQQYQAGSPGDSQRSRSVKMAARTSAMHISMTTYVARTLGDYYKMKFGSVGFSPGRKVFPGGTHQARGKKQHGRSMGTWPRVPLPRWVGSRQNVKIAPLLCKKRKKLHYEWSAPLGMSLEKDKRRRPFSDTCPRTPMDGKGAGGGDFNNSVQTQIKYGESFLNPANASLP